MTEIFNGVTFVSQGHTFTVTYVWDDLAPALLGAWAPADPPSGVITTRAAAAVKPDNPQVYPDWVDTSEHRDAKHVIDHILGGKIGAPGRQALRKAIDTVDADPQGRAKHDQALGRALRVSPPGIVR